MSCDLFLVHFTWKLTVQRLTNFLFNEKTRYEDSIDKSYCSLDCSQGLNPEIDCLCVCPQRNHYLDHHFLIDFSKF